MSNVNKINTNLEIFDFEKITNSTSNSSQLYPHSSVENIDILELGKGPIRKEDLNKNVNDENIVRVDELREILKTGDKSNRLVVEAVCDSIQEEIDKGNMEAYRFLEAIIRTKKEYPGLAFDISGTSSYYLPLTKTVVIGTSYLSSNSIIFHEIGHALHDLNANGEYPNNFDELQNKVRKNIENINYWEFMDYFSNSYGFIYNQCLTEKLSENNMNYEQYLEYRMGWHKVKIKEDPDYVREITEHQIQSEIMEDVDLRLRSSGLVAMEDMMDAVFDGDLMGYRKDSNGNDFFMLGHGDDYYDGFGETLVEFINGDQKEYNELIANYTDLRVGGNTQALNSIKYMLGDELYNEIEKTYEKSIGF